jgi:hypothetical protein
MRISSRLVSRLAFTLDALKAEALDSKLRARPLDIEAAKWKLVALGGIGIFK